MGNKGAAATGPCAKSDPDMLHLLNSPHHWLLPFCETESHVACCRAPGAKAMALVGEFNNWEPKDNHWAFKNEFGVWELFLPDNNDGSQAIPHR